jgi:hypothetical protein
MQIESPTNVMYFVLFFIPGFIMMRIYGLLVADEKINFSSALIEVVAFSCVNYAFCSPLILIIINKDWPVSHFGWFVLTMFGIIFIFPILLVLGFVLVRKSKWASNNKLLDIHKSSWDYFFSYGKAKWVVVNLKNGKKIGGRYIGNSHASSFPNKDIYISEIWHLKKNGGFDKVVNRTAGILILELEISSIEFIN